MRCMPSLWPIGNIRPGWKLIREAPGDVGKMVFTFDKIALIRGQVFRVYFYQEDPKPKDMLFRSVKQYRTNSPGLSRYRFP